MFGTSNDCVLYSECPLSEVLLYVEGDVMVADLVWQHSLAHRIHCMWYGDLTHDGLSELAVVSTGGIHILQVSRLQASQCQLQLYFTKSPVHSLQNFHTLHNFIMYSTTILLPYLLYHTCRMYEDLCMVLVCIEMVVFLCSTTWSRPEDW